MLCHALHKFNIMLTVTIHLDCNLISVIACIYISGLYRTAYSEINRQTYHIKIILPAYVRRLIR